MAQNDKQELKEAVEQVEAEVPGKARRFIEWVFSDKARIYRIPIALAMIAVGIFLPYLPIVGIEDVPLGLMLLAYDIPFLRKPMAKMVKYLVARWRRLKLWWKKR